VPANQKMLVLVNQKQEKGLVNQKQVKGLVPANQKMLVPVH
jgi:hypothetical protein